MKLRLGESSRKLALISGAGTRLGVFLAKGLGEAGMDIALHCKHSTRGAHILAQRLRRQGICAEVFVADFEEAEGPQRLAQEVCKRMGVPHILIHNAAVMEGKVFGRTSVECLDRLWKVNVRAAFLLSQQLAGPMRRRGGGSILHILDIAGVGQTWKGYAAYAMTKAALAQLCRSLAKELAPRLRVNAIAPGLVLPAEGISVEATARLVSKIPMKEKVSPESLVQAMFFLLSNKSMTGQILVVDGGRSL
ncbi:MAG: SDR family oxidoreductase [Proteobacteria bacterium]|nr:SDR family oxidoreductase [Cystobacterineae bacterium]MCL2259361.1 SDR family oxidoreductase [Cystobacterineae bacterium]MCL2314192.1 SDR family oxidoreductase [Pseudomonadota bacterium]